MDLENEYGTLAMQQYLLPIIADIDKFCRSYGIHYSISDGTLLGAVRHKGFIPWDDDIDISLDRANFDKLMNVVDKLPSEYEVIHDIWIRRISRKDNPKKNSFPPEGCIDLFIFDDVPNNKRIEKIQVFVLRLLQGMIKTNVIYEGFSLKKKALLFGSHIIGKIFPMKIKKRWYDSVSQWGNNGHSKKVARFNGSYKGIGNARYPKSILNGYEKIEFDGLGLQALKGKHEFLKIMYGDYMKVPEKNARKTTHEHIGVKS